MTRAASTTEVSGSRPTALRAPSAGGARDGDLAARYDAAGNLVAMDVTRAGPCLPLGATCSQHYAYEWDEVGRLARARRWDSGRAVDEERDVANADLRYAYDATDQRTLKTAVDARGQSRHTVYALSSLELRSARFDGTAYEHTEATEVPYLFANGVRLARVAGGREDLPQLASGALHVLLELPDHLGSTSLVIDLGTSELVERATYQTYGATDSDYRPERWGAFREEYRFTGKEEDIEVGLQYFGQRYYAPAVNRWISADPLAIHEPGEADLNVYAYVKGRVLVAVDLEGLQSTTPVTPMSAPGPGTPAPVVAPGATDVAVRMPGYQPGSFIEPRLPPATAPGAPTLPVEAPAAPTWFGRILGVGGTILGGVGVVFSFGATISGDTALKPAASTPPSAPEYHDITRPSLLPTVVRMPGGTPTPVDLNRHDEVSQRSYVRENDSARIVSHAGYDVIQNPGVKGVDGRSDPDCLIEGRSTITHHRLTTFVTSSRNWRRRR